LSRYEKVKNGAALWGAYYRANPEKFVQDYLHIRLHRFQKLLLVMMFWSTTYTFIACRGIGKTYLSAIYCVTRAILYPGTRVCVVSSTRGQALLVLEKIQQELKHRSAELRAEINEKETKVNNTVGQIVFKNTSVIKVVTASDSSRGNRANVLLIDEFRLVPKFIIDTVLDKFLIYRRTPPFSMLTDEERKAEYDKEKNLTLYLSSAWLRDSWAYAHCEETFDKMVSGRSKSFVCGFPYQLALEEGRLDKEKVKEDLAARDFNEAIWKMEMCAEWYGSGEDAFFDSESISKNRRIHYPMLPYKYSSLLPSAAELRITPKPNGSYRILSADIALMPSKRHKNDATAIFINQMTPTKTGRYLNNIIYSESCEGLRTDDQALVIRKLFDEYGCDYLVLDCQGLGLGVYDCLAKDLPDPETGEIYPAISCCNNPEMAARCSVVGADKVIWAIKASAAFNSDCAFLLREGFRSGRIRLLVSELESRELMNNIKGYKSLSGVRREEIKMPYYNTDFLMNELIELQHEEAGGKVKIYEKSGMRKDRYSSLAYNYYVATQIENKLIRRKNIHSDSVESFIIKPPQYKGKAVNNRYGNNRGWY
jgi:hypothetical protein